MEYYFIHQFISNVFDNKCKKCVNCNKMILQMPIYYKKYILCSYKCLTIFYENNYIKIKN